MVTAVIPVHNQKALLARLLATLRAQTQPFAEIILVDNASTDGAADHPDLTVIRLPVNTGFAHAVNTGWQAARTPLVAILNSDVELDPQWLEQLTTAIGDAGFATGTILQAANPALIDGTFDLLSRAGCAWRAGFGQPADTLPATLTPIALVPATACIYRREVLERLGGFDERFGSYLEDVDLGLRCLNARIGGVFVPQARAVHLGSATLGRWNPRVVRLLSRNQLLLISRHYDRPLFFACLWHILAGQLLWGIVSARHGAFLPWLAGKFDALRVFRLEGSPDATFRAFLDASEREINSRAREPYWRWYFRLTWHG